MSFPKLADFTSSNWKPFKDDSMVIKSEWSNSIWNRKQIWIRVESSGELPIQTIAQNIFARIASTFLKLLSCGQAKSIGKKVIAFSQPGYTLSRTLEIPLSENKQKQLLDLQRTFAIPLLPLSQVINEPIDTKLTLEQPLQEVLSGPEEISASPTHSLSSISEEPDEAPTLLIAEESPEITTSNEPQATNITIASSQKSPYLTLLEIAEKRILDLRNSHQFTSAELLHDEIEKVKRTSPEESTDPQILKSAMESLEDALDSLEENVSFPNQLLALPHDSPHEQILKELVILDIYQKFYNFKADLKDKKEKIDSLLKDTQHSPWHEKIRDFFETTPEKIKCLIPHFDKFQSRIPGLQTARHVLNSWINKEEFKSPLETLNRHDLVKHHATIEHSCKSALAFLEEQTQVEKSLALVIQYENANTLIKAKCAQLEEKGQFLHLYRLESTQQKDAEKIKKLSSSLSSASQALKYSQALEAACYDLNKELHDTQADAEMTSLKQLLALQTLSSKHYESLQARLINNAKIQLTAYIELLTGYKTKLEVVIPILQEHNSTILDQALEIQNKINTKIAESTSLSTDYAVRLHFWHIFPKLTPISQLSPVKLHEYLESITHTMQSGISEITHDAAEAGFKFD